MGAAVKAVFMPLRRNDGLVAITGEHPEVAFAVSHSVDELRRALPGCAVLVMNSAVYTPEVAEVVRAAGDELRWLQFTTSGIDRALRNGLPPGVTVTNAPGIKAPTVAEHAMTLLLALVRRVRDIETARAKKQWARFEINSEMTTLEGATLVIVGFGSIGAEIARKAKAFDMRTVAVSDHAAPGGLLDASYTYARRGEAFAAADAVVLCAPSERRTRRLLGAAEIAVLRSSVYVVNVGRGDLIDEGAFAAALCDGRICGAAIDVAVEEPLPSGHPFWSLDNLVISPHVAGGGSSGYLRFVRLFNENLRRFRAGEALLNVVATDDPASSAGPVP